MSIFSGWEGYQQSLVSAIGSLTPEQLTHRLAPQAPSAGAVAAHIAYGRIGWFAQMGAAGAAELLEEVAPWQPWEVVDPRFEETPDDLLALLGKSWNMVEATLNAWTVEDLAATFHLHYNGKLRDVSRQWVIWRVMAHDIHHGGQITILLAAQGIFPAGLGNEGGHIIEPPAVQG
jgi:uncharacterized damage-inducible protein DinB